LTHPLITRLRDPDPETRRSACGDAVSDPSAILLVDALCDTLADPEKTVARAASDALAAIGSQDATVGGRLQAVLRGDDRGARWWAAFTVARLEPPPIRLLPTLLDALEHAEGDVRWSAAKILVEMGRLEGEVLPVLLHYVGGGERPEARRMAIFCLRELAPDRPETARALLDASRSEDLDVRRAALSAMAALMEPPAAAWTRLTEAADGDPDPASRRLAAGAIAGLAHRPGGDPGVAWLRRAAEGAGDPQVREAASRALARPPHGSG
jgi:HEAT repeat protein